jgi:hypothetical protein
LTSIDSDVAILICSRGRERHLMRLLADLRSHFVPALTAGRLTVSIWVYAQHYSPEFMVELSGRFADLLDSGALVIEPNDAPHKRIGEVVHAAGRLLNERSRYRLAMLMDDDSVYYPDPHVDRNLREAAGTFIARDHRAYSIKLGSHAALDYKPFVDLASPIMPFKEKMLWVSRQVLEEALALPRFSELSIGEDAVIAAAAWLPAPDRCFGVYGIATFLHLGYESVAEFGDGAIEGGYADLVAASAGPPSAEAHYGKYDDALRRGVTPFHVLPDVFVPEGHPYFEYNGVRENVVAAIRSRGHYALAGSQGGPRTAPLPQG